MPVININDVRPDIDNIVSEYTKSLGELAKKAEEEIKAYLGMHDADYIEWAEAFANSEITESQLKTMAQGEKLVIEGILLKYLLKASIETEDNAKKIALLIAKKIIKILIGLITNETV